MFLLNVHIAISILCFVLMILSCIDIKYKFKKKYPDLKSHKDSFAGTILSYIKTIVVSVTPLFNIIMIWNIVFKYSKLEKDTIQKIYLECMGEDNVR